MTRLRSHPCAVRFLGLLVLVSACESERELRPVIHTQVTAAGSCLAQAGTVQTVSGVQTAAFTNTSLADNTGIDASAAQWRTAAHISIRLGGGANVCFHGGETVGNLPPATTWSTALNYYAMVPDGPNVTVEGVRTFNRGDGVAFGSNAPNWTLRGAYVHYARDGCVENHFVFAGTVDDALLDGCFIGFASRPYQAVADGSGNVMTIQNTLVRLQPMDGVYTGPVPGHGAFFEWSATSPQLALYNDVFRADQPSNDGDEHMAPPPGKLAGCANNVMVWLGPGPYPEPLPSCFTLMTGAAGLDYWNQAVAQWKANHPPATADVGPPVVSLFAPAANATVTGAVTLTATAVDDRELAEVRFQLDGQDLGAATTTDLTPTKYTLPWDSRGSANGTHTLTATAHDAAGNSATAAGIPVTISN